MEYKYKFTEKAERDLDDILAYISDELCNPQAAAKLGREIFLQIENVCNFPESGMLVENEYISDKGIRKLLVENYTVYCKAVTNEKTVYIVRIVYSRRNQNAITKTIT